MRIAFAATVMMVVACGGEKSAPPPVEKPAETKPAPPPPPKPPLAIRYGACGDGAARFVSGEKLTSWTPVPSGYGIGGRRSSSAPTLTFGTPDVQGGLDGAIVRRYLKRNAPKLTYCYEKRLLTMPAIKGIVDAGFTIGLDGKVTKTAVTQVDEELDECVMGVIEGIEFPKPRAALPAVVLLQLLYWPSYSDEDRPVMRKIRPNASAAVIEQARAADKAAPPVDEPPPVNLLQPHEAELRACLEKHPKGFGVAAVQLGATDPRGESDDEAVRVCLDAFAKSIPADGGARCAVAFGIATAADAPGVDLGDDGVAFAGMSVVGAEEVKRFDARRQSIAPLSTHVLPDSVSIVQNRTYVIRATMGTPLARVRNAIDTLATAQALPVLAVKRASGWVALGAPELPVVPTPTSSPTKSTATAPLARLIIHGTDVEVFPVIADKPVVAIADLAKTITPRAATDWVEIVVRDEGTYENLVGVIDALAAAKVTTWRLSP